MSSFNTFKVLIWAIFVILVLQVHNTKQKSLNKPLQYQHRNVAKTTTLQQNWPTYYRSAATTKDYDDDDVVDFNRYNDMMIRSLMEEIVAKSNLVDTTGNPENMEIIFPKETIEVEGTSMNDTRAKIAMKTGIKYANTIERGEDMNNNFDKNQKLKLKTQDLVAENVVKNKKFKPDETLLEATESVDTKTKVFDEQEMQNNKRLSHGNEQNKAQGHLFEEEQNKYQTTMESLKELKTISQEEKSAERNPTQQENNISELAMNSKVLEDTKVKKLFFDSTVKSAQTKEDLKVNAFKEETAKQTTMEGLTEEKPILNEVKSEKLQQTQQETVNTENLVSEDTQMKQYSINSNKNHTKNKLDLAVNDMKEKSAKETTVESIKQLRDKEKSQEFKSTQQNTLNSEKIMNFKEVDDTQLNKPVVDAAEKSAELQPTQQENVENGNVMNFKMLPNTQVKNPLNDAAEEPTKNKTNVLVNEGAHLDEPLVVKYINFTITADHAHIRQAEEIIKTKQNDAVLKIQLDDLQVKAPEIKKIVKNNRASDDIKVATEETAKDHNKLSNEEKTLENEESLVQKEALEKARNDSKQSLSNNTKATNESSLKSTEQDTFQFDQNATKNTLEKHAQIDKLPEVSLNVHENQAIKVSVFNDEIKDKVFGETNFMVMTNALEELEEANFEASKEVPDTTEASIQHVLDTPNSMVKKNDLQETSTAPFIVYSISTTEKPTENVMESTNLTVKKNDIVEKATTNPSQGFETTAGVIRPTKIQQMGPVGGDGEEIFNIGRPAAESTLAHTQLDMQETKDNNLKATTIDKQILTVSKFKILNSTKIYESNDKMKTVGQVQKKVFTEPFTQEVTMKPLLENPSNEESFNGNESDFVIDVDNIKHKLSIALTEDLENSLTINEYVSKILQALKPAIEDYESKYVNTTNNGIMQTIFDDMDSVKITKDAINMDSQIMQNSGPENEAQLSYIESIKDKSSEAAENNVTNEVRLDLPLKADGNDAITQQEPTINGNKTIESQTKVQVKDFFGIQAPIIMSNNSHTKMTNNEKLEIKENLPTFKTEMEMKKTENVSEEIHKTEFAEAYFEKMPINVQKIKHIKTDATEMDYKKPEDPKLTEKMKEDQQMETIIAATLNEDSLNKNKFNTTDKKGADKIIFKEVEKLRNEIVTILKKAPYKVKEFMTKLTKLMKEAVSDTSAAGNKDTDTAVIVKEKTEESIVNNTNQINNNFVEHENKNMNVEEFNQLMTDVLEERPVTQLNINAVENKFTKKNEELRDVLKETALRDVISESTTTGNKNTETILNSKEQLEDKNANKNNQISNNTVENVNRNSVEELSEQSNEGNKNVKTSTSLVDKLNEFSDESENQTANYFVKKHEIKTIEELKAQLEEKFEEETLTAATESTTTENKSNEMSTSLEEELDESSIDNEYEIIINSEEKDNINFVEELNEQIKEVLEEPLTAEVATNGTTGNKNTETTFSLEEYKQESPNSPLNMNTLDKKIIKGDEQYENETVSSAQAAKLENFIENRDKTEIVKAEVLKEFIKPTNKKTQVNNIRPIAKTTMPPIFNMNSENNSFAKLTPSPPSNTGEVFNHNHAENNEHSENLLIKTIKTEMDDDDDMSTKQAYAYINNKNLPIIKKTNITKLNEDVTTTITCITTFQPDSLGYAEKKIGQTIKNNDTKIIQNNAKLTTNAANDVAVDDDDDSFKQHTVDELPPEFKLVTWQTYTDSKFKGYQTEELTGRNRQNIESLADESEVNKENDDDEAHDDGDEDDADDDENDDDDYVSAEVDEDVDPDSPKIAPEQVYNDNHHINSYEDKPKKDVNENVDGQFVINEQMYDVKSVINDPNLSLSNKHYRIDDNVDGNRKHQLDQMAETAQMAEQYPYTKHFNAQKNKFSEAYEFPTTPITPTTTTNSTSTATTKNWWSTLHSAEIRKFLNSISNGAADEIYRELARRKKMVK